jgi:chloramphenicol O-acetyltransferase
MNLTNMLTFQKLSNFFQKQPAISLPDFSREIGKERNYMNNLLKSGKLSERQAKQLLPFLQKYGYAEDVL